MIDNWLEDIAVDRSYTMALEATHWETTYFPEEKNTILSATGFSTMEERRRCIDDSDTVSINVQFYVAINVALSGPTIKVTLAIVIWSVNTKLWLHIQYYNRH